jgi:hypothetical protein
MSKGPLRPTPWRGTLSLLVLLGVAAAMIRTC